MYGRAGFELLRALAYFLCQSRLHWQCTKLEAEPDSGKLTDALATGRGIRVLVTC